MNANHGNKPFTTSSRLIRTFLIIGMVLGGILALGPFWGIAGAVFGMMQAFETLGKQGIASPDQLSDAVGVSLFSTATGLFVCPVGIALLVLCIVLFTKMQKETPPPLPR